MKYFLTLLLVTSLISLASTRYADEDEKDSDLALEEDFMEDVMSNYVFSDENVALYADGEEHSINKRASSTWDSKTRPELHILYYIAIVIVVVLIVVGLSVWICCPCNCLKCGRN